MKMIRKVHQVAYHRNGVAGNGFHAVLFTATTRERMIATVFDERGNIAVLRVPDLAQNDGVTFGVNSWRGDDYEPELRAAILQSIERDEAWRRVKTRHQRIDERLQQAALVVPHLVWQRPDGCECCGEPVGEGGALCPACLESR